MAVAKVKKVRIIIHQSEFQNLLQGLQEKGILHIECKQKDAPPTDLDQLHMRLERVINELGEGEKKSFLASVLPEKEPMKISDLKKTIESVNIDKFLNDYLEARKGLDELINQSEKLDQDIRTFEPWSEIDFDPGYWKESTYLSIIPATFPDRQAYQIALANVGDRDIEIVLVGEKEKVSCLLITTKKNEAKTRFWISEQDGEIVELPKTGRIKEQVERLKQERAKIVESLEKQKTAIETFKSLIERFRVIYDAVVIDRDRQKMESILPKTSYTSVISGWIKEKDQPILAEIIEATDTGIVQYLPIEDDEEPPVALENKPIFKPFEMIVNLYSAPNSKEVDPSSLISIFFVFFFGLCLTDAMYGIILAVLAYIGLRKLRAGRELLWILLGGGLATIIPGALTGGWFGNLFEMLPFRFLADFRAKLMLFDPMKDPMPFFYFALLVGYIQVMFGIAIEAYDDFRNRDYASAFFNNITWILFLNSIPLVIIFKNLSGVFGLIGIVNATLILVFTRRGGVSIIDQLIWFAFFFLIILKIASRPLGLPFAINPYLLLVPFAAIIVRFRTLKRMMKKLAWGIYGFYNGTVSFISAVISYVRLMALGMVTAGIAMVINTVIGMVSGIPVLGLIIGVLIFIGGTIFNIAINTLGGFIHTMRLQYVEFFQRFYVGGGRRFEPFGYRTRFYELRR